MNRLRDDGGDDPVAIRGIELLRGTPPTPRMPDMKRRVWLSHQQPRARRAPVFHLSKLRLAVVVGGAILCIAGTSGAVIAARRWIVPALREGSNSGTKVASSAPVARGHARAGKRSKVVGSATELKGLPDDAMAESVEATATPEVPATPPAGSLLGSPNARTAAPGYSQRAPGAGPALRSSRAAARRASSGAAPAAARSSGASGPEAVAVLAPGPAMTAASARERTQVLDAMIALRRDHDPVGAGAMLDHYLTAHPNGVLREEALVLSIEAASARGDHAVARSLARAYQDAYPSGRFRRFAQSQAAADPS